MEELGGRSVKNRTRVTRIVYSAYVDGTTFFLRNEKSATEIVKLFDKFSLFSGLKINNAMCEIAGIGVKKRVN